MLTTKDLVLQMDVHVQELCNAHLIIGTPLDKKLLKPMKNQNTLGAIFVRRSRANYSNTYLNLVELFDEFLGRHDKRHKLDVQFRNILKVFPEGNFLEEPKDDTELFTIRR